MKTITLKRIGIKFI
jgi:hypothetical protein